MRAAFILGPCVKYTLPLSSLVSRVSIDTLDAAFQFCYFKDKALEVLLFFLWSPVKLALSHASLVPIICTVTLGETFQIY